MFFADDDGENNAIDVNNIELYIITFSADQMFNQGGYEHEFSYEVTPALSTVQFKSNAATQYASVPYSTDFDIPVGRDFTVECWIQIGAGISSDPSFISNKDWDSGSNHGWNLAAKDDAWDLNIGDSRIEDEDSRADWDPPNLNDGQWHHVGFSWDRQNGDSIFVFTDDIYGVVQAISEQVDGDFQDVINTDNFALNFGQDGTGNYGADFPGSLDEVRIWHAALSKETLQEWRHKEITSDHPNYGALVGYWNFNETEGNVITDHSTKGHDAELVHGFTRKVSYAPLAFTDALTQTDVTALYGGHGDGAGHVAPVTSGGMSIVSEFEFDGGLLSKTVANPLLKSQGVAAAVSFVEEMYAVIGHNNSDGVSSADIGGSVEGRIERIWYYETTETFDQVVGVMFSQSATPGAEENYVLLSRSGTSGVFEATAATATVIDNEISFSAIALDAPGYYTLGSTNLSASPLSSITDIGELKAPFTYALKSNYPNPFNPNTNIEFSIAKASDVKLTIYNVLGQEIAQLLNVKMQAAGSYKVVWNAQTLASGIYFYRLEAGEFTKIKKMMLMK